MEKLKTAVLIPDRNDRPEFLKNCLQMMEAQTVKPDHIELVNYPAESNKCDITQRYRRGYEKLKGKYDVILLIENDDYYAPEYIETMVSEWSKSKPEILGMNYTIYYHIGIKKYFVFKHAHRSSAMNTLLRGDLTIPWPKDSEPYTDLHLWQNLKGYTFDPGRPIAFGIKHGTGMSGGHFHSSMMDRYKKDDSNMEYLKSITDDRAFKFYQKISKNVQG